MIDRGCDGAPPETPQAPVPEAIGASGSLRSDLCILVATCARYAAVADLTLRQIAASWHPAPPVFLCGIDRGDALPLREDPADWMAVAASAVGDLRERGYRWVYLILDDHPPIGPCAAKALNTLLPDLAEEMHATHVGLLGSGQRREAGCQRLTGRHACLAKNARDYRWKFSLHPALWSVDRLGELLAARMGQYGVGERTPWNFERHRDVAGGPVRDELLDGSYRVVGPALCGRAGQAAVAAKEPGLFAFDVWRFLLRLGISHAARHRFDLAGLWLYHVYVGPYPIYWSGAIRGGKPSPEFLTYLHMGGRFAMLKDWIRLRDTFAAASC